MKEAKEALGKELCQGKEKTSEMLAGLEEKLEGAGRSQEGLERQLRTCRAELAQVRLERDVLRGACEDSRANAEWSMPLVAHHAALAESKRLFDELKAQFESEKARLVARLQAFETGQPESEKRVIALTAQRDHFKMQAHDLNKAIK